MKRYRHTGLRGCVIMLSPWKYLTIPNKETDHENLRILLILVAIAASQPNHWLSVVMASIAHFLGSIAQTHSLRSKGGRRKSHGKYSFRRRRDPRNGGSSGTPSRLGHLLVSLP